MIYETFACRHGKETHAAMYHTQKHAGTAQRKRSEYYILKCAIKSFFPSINHDVVIDSIRRHIRGRKTMNILGVIIRSCESPNQDGKSIPIGALTSQLDTNIVLTHFDHWIKKENHVELYAGYMDDFIILHNDKQYLWELLYKIEKYLRDNLKLNLNQKTGIFPGRNGIDFCGYRIWPTHVRRTKRRLRKMAREYKINPGILNHARASIQS